jgi:hypothetical protein
MENRWREVDLRLDEILPLTHRMVFRFVACDHVDPDSYVEAAVDDFSIETLPRDPVAAPLGDARAVFDLRPGRPNPQPSERAVLEFSLERAAPARLEIYAVTGRLVRRLIDRDCPAGWQNVHWDGTDEAGSPAGPGVYFCRLEAEGRSVTRRLVRVR